MPSEIIWGTLAGLFIAAIYLIDKVGKRDALKLQSSTWMQKHAAIVGIVAIGIPMIVGVILVNTVFGNAPVRKIVHKRVDRPAHAVHTKPVPRKPEPILKLIISDGSQQTDVSVLNRCAADEVTIVQNGIVQCGDQQSPVIRAWLEDARVHEKEALRKFIEHQVQKQTLQSIRRRFTQKRKPNVPVMKQGFFLLKQMEAGTTTEATVKTTTKKKPFKDRHAELFYFLALVLGVLGKYFWDYYEDKRSGKPATFEPHLIVMSFIIAALVYYSIQQGIEKEVGKLSTRGLVFAFNNGFMWQTILTSMSRRRNGQATQPSNEGSVP